MGCFQSKERNESPQIAVTKNVQAIYQSILKSAEPYIERIDTYIRPPAPPKDEVDNVTPAGSLHGSRNHVDPSNLNYTYPTGKINNNRIEAADADRHFILRPNQPAHSKSRRTLMKPRETEPNNKSNAGNNVYANIMGTNQFDDSHKPDPKAAKAYEAALEAYHNSIFKLAGPDIAMINTNDCFGCFKDGLLFRIIDGNHWAFYNDTQDYEMHATVTLSSVSKVTPVGKTQRVEGNKFTVVVYPGETELFVEGKVNGYSSSFSAKPISEQYKNSVIEKANIVVKTELRAVLALATSAVDVETTLGMCINRSIPFVDPSFKPHGESLFRSGVDARALSAAWQRPSHFLPENLRPFIVKFREIEASDIDQGQLGDCWLLSAIAAIAEFPIRIQRLFKHPISKQIALREEKLGAYRVSLNISGWWTNIIVDDYLPTIGGKPCFANNIEDPAELWPSIIEKAFAKVFGSYSSICGGDALVALKDLTGFPTSRFDDNWKEAQGNKDKSDAFFDKLVSYDQSHFLTIVNTPGNDTAAYAGGKNDAAVEDKYKKAGLALGHAYTLIDVRTFPKHNIRLCKIRNPWGNGTEWTGTWSDDSELWARYPDVKAACKPKVDADGTFWMDFEDVKQYFDGGGVCYSRENWHDYRIKGAFAGKATNIVLEITVTKPAEAYLTLSQVDRKTLSAENPNYKYAATMLSVCKPAANQATHYDMHLNSDTDPCTPSEKHRYLYARDNALKYTFLPSKDPYIVIPLIHGNEKHVAFTMGLVSDTAVGAGLSVRFKQVDPNSKVFLNYSKFEFNPFAAQPVEAEYQSVNPLNFSTTTRKTTAIIA